MKHDSMDAEALRAIELVDHRRDRFRVELRAGRGQVDEIRRVREHRLEMPALAKEREVIVRHDLPLPLIGVLREQRDGAGADLDGAPERGVQAAACRHVRAEQIAMLGREAEAGHGPAITRHTLPVIPNGRDARVAPAHLGRTFRESTGSSP